MMMMMMNKNLKKNKKVKCFYTGRYYLVKPFQKLFDSVNIRNRRSMQPFAGTL